MTDDIKVEGVPEKYKVNVVEDIKVEPLVKAPEVNKQDTFTIFFFIYILYICNILSRNNLRELLAAIKKPLPENLPKYLLEESTK